MDRVTVCVLGGITAVAMVCVTVLAWSGAGDAVSLGVLSTLVVQVANYCSTHSVREELRSGKRGTSDDTHE